jgi:hypothetical protein
LTAHDLEIRDTEAAVTVAVLKDAFGAVTVRH